MEKRLHITVNHTGKMTGMQSLSTSCKTNLNCAKYAQIEGSVCQKCYALRQMKYHTNVSEAYERNADILTTRVLDKEELPLINACYFRFEAFGDLHNVTQAINYFNICKKNPDVRFALWTKNPGIIKEIADKKPKNLVIIVSSLFLNKPVDIEKMPWIDKVFTVYDKETIERENVKINCGARNCLECHRCYKKGGDKYVNEKLK